MQRMKQFYERVQEFAEKRLLRTKNDPKVVHYSSVPQRDPSEFFVVSVEKEQPTVTLNSVYKSWIRRHSKRPAHENLHQEFAPVAPITLEDAPLHNEEHRLSQNRFKFQFSLCCTSNNENAAEATKVAHSKATAPGLNKFS